jgi:hypothetical protein
MRVVEIRILNPTLTPIQGLGAPGPSKPTETHRLMICPSAWKQWGVHNCMESEREAKSVQNQEQDLLRESQGLPPQKVSYRHSSQPRADVDLRKQFSKVPDSASVARN